MNKTRRKILRSLCDHIGSIKEKLESVMDEEQDAYDNLPENIQASDRGDLMMQNVDSLQEAVDGLEDVYDKIDTIAAC